MFHDPAEQEQRFQPGADGWCSIPPPIELPTQPTTELIQELYDHHAALEMRIEELRQVQISLTESRDRYRDLYEFSPVGYFTLSREGLIIEANHTASLLLGMKHHELLLRHFDPFLVSPEDRDCWNRIFMSVLPNGERQYCELALQREDDSIFHAHLDCWHVVVGNISAVCIALSDITERKRAEEELRIAAIAFESQEGMVVTNEKGIIVRVNQAFCNLTGYSAEELVGQMPTLLQSGRHDKTFFARMRETLREKNFWQGEIWNKRKNGKIYAEWLTISAVTAPDGRIDHYVGIFSEITQNKEAEAEIHRLAYYDPLTQLPNRRLLYDRLGQALASSARQEHHGAILFLDLDNFKTLNDTLGHDVGDQLLVEVAQRLQSAVRGDDTIARLGGDEFVLLLEDLSKDMHEAAIQVSLIAEKVLVAIAAPYLLNGVEFNCTASIGISLYYDHAEPIDELLKQADLAMFHAKKCGRNVMRFFDPDMQAKLLERTALENDLRQALKSNQFRLYYQIQVNSDRRAIGAEALLRWEHPERGLISPADFIPLAEETGLILPIGLWVLQTACTQISNWSGNPATCDLQLAVNVSPRQFRQPDFVCQVQQAFSDSGIDPKRLKIELTEGLALENLNDTVTKMHALITHGISLSMDDFGTGYSSLTHLKKLPLDQLKIDQSFVREIDTDPNDAAIVQAIITMGKTFGLHVIAEGVETENQLDLLDQYGCRAYQGFLFGRPVPAIEFDRLLVHYA